MNETQAPEVIHLNGQPPLLKERARLVPIRDNETLGRLFTAAKADNHQVLAPTHVMLRGDQIIGYLSLGGIPTVQAWFDTQSGHVLDSLKMIEMGEAILASQGAPGFCVMVSKDSPFFPHMQRLGFEPVMETTFWKKKL